ncbi:phosphate ABC transporter substrate-binding protein PstS [Rugosimonospora africana]|uniref:Phosphate-binding protein n=1 Tax=Rugosimonospora africana TaxID=556532 RepID=A0A8J3QLP5_9ACTN|nr:phosphate ABC transporter substrate-binding protein PstS [Rugosimonospora africana]GIH12362.1 phosphate-binding protein PstS [Rugosimonospora africana]
MKLQRHGILAGLALTATFALAACGSDNNTTPPANAGGGSSSASNPIACASGTLNAAGSTAQQNAINEWVKDYQTSCSGANIVYTGNGSGAGQQAFISGTADFAGSDSALTAADQPKADARCKTGPAIHLPMAVGPIAVVYNVQGVTNLQLKPATLAKIFAGKITTWNDAAIKADNPSATLPSTKILTVHRSDSSGTSDNFTKYLGTVDAADWTFGHDKTWKGPGGDAEKGSDGIASLLGKTDGAIGYVEWSFAQADSLNVAKVGNGAGEFATLDGDSAGKTIASAKTTGSGDDMQLSIDYNTTAAGAYPIVLVTYEIVCEKGNDATKLPLLKDFLSYTASTGGQQAITKVGYAPLPDSVRAKVASTVSNLS